jgi:creatinine amidohydrolase
MQASVYYTDFRWPELKTFAERDAVVLLPIGQTEEHGPHLPVGCDYYIAQETARAVAEKASETVPVLVLPALWCGYSGKDLFHWPGVISMPPEVVISVIENICLSLGRSGFRKIITMNSHGHHVGIARVAARKVADQSDVCVVVTDIWKLANDVVSRIRESQPGGCCHAGEYETSLLLHFAKRVDLPAAQDEPVTPHTDLVSNDNFGASSKVFWSTWRYHKSQTGTYGSPCCASAEKGKLIFDETIEAYVSLLRQVHAAP